MSAADLHYILPLLILSFLAALLLLVVGTLRLRRRIGMGLVSLPWRKTECGGNSVHGSREDEKLAVFKAHLQVFITVAAGLGAAFLSLFLVISGLPKTITPLLIIDGYGIVFLGLILSAGLAWVALSYGYLADRNEPIEEYYLLLVLAILGACTVVISNHFAAFFLGLEILNVSLYALIAYFRSNTKSVEAALKYIILAAASDAFLLFGIALLYAESGTLIFSKLVLSKASATAFTYSGLALFFVGIGFKLALVPFHMWAPDVYEGAPAPIAGFIATISKAAVFAILFRFLQYTNLFDSPILMTWLTVVAIASMVVGNLGALLQNNVKRILAYSSISHMGYLLIAMIAVQPTAILFYFAAYFLTLLGAFGVIAAISGPHGDVEELQNYRGIAWRRPWIALVFSTMLLSLAGIPVTAGFIAKFYLVSAGVGSSLWLLVTMLIINSVIGLFYYLRIMVVMYATDESTGQGFFRFAGRPNAIALVLIFAGVIVFGLFPGLLIDLVQLTITVEYF